MYGEIITVGNELTSGRTLDLNAWYAAGRLTAAGLRVTRITSVGDDHAMLAEALTRALGQARFVIVTGGLGATEDDMTNEIAAQALQRPLCLDRRMFERIQRHVASRGLEMTPALEKMAWMPQGARLLNPRQPFCGFSLREKDVPVYFLPGVPDQMRYLMERFVLPEIVGRYETLPVVRQRVLKVFGLNEPNIAEIFRSLQNREKGITFGFYPHFPENHITLTLRGRDEDSVLRELDRVEAEARTLLGAHLFATDDQSMEEAAGLCLGREDKTLAVAESCTGGMIGHRLTNVPGSSGYFLGAAVVYSNEAKVRLLGISPDNLARHGAVSDAVAQEMAAGARAKFESDLGLAVTGIAGPGGGSRAKPVGTVHLALAAADRVQSRPYRFWGTRLQIKQQTSAMALDWIRRHLCGYPFLPGL